MMKDMFKPALSLSNSIQDQVKIVDLTVEDVSNITKIHAFLHEYDEQIVSTFYEKILAIPHLKHIIEEHSTIERLKETLKQHLHTMFTSRIDEEYFSNRKQIALIHYMIKLEPKWYIASFQYLCNQIQTLMYEQLQNKEEAIYLGTIVGKYISLEMQIVLEAYETKALSNQEIDQLLLQIDLETE